MVRIMAEGNIPGPVVSWIASALLAALMRTKDEGHRSVAVGETLRRFLEDEIGDGTNGD